MNVKDDISLEHFIKNQMLKTITGFDLNSLIEGLVKGDIQIAKITKYTGGEKK